MNRAEVAILALLVGVLIVVVIAKWPDIMRYVFGEEQGPRN